MTDSTDAPRAYRVAGVSQQRPSLPHPPSESAVPARRSRRARDLVSKGHNVPLGEPWGGAQETRSPSISVNHVLCKKLYIFEIFFFTTIEIFVKVVLVHRVDVGAT